MTKLNPLITVYITNYNYGQFINKAINSVLNQTFKNFELIIIDDGSKDKSTKIIKKFQDKKNVKIVFQNNTKNWHRHGWTACVWGQHENICRAAFAE